MDYISSRDARILDINSAYLGVPRIELMEEAGRGVFEVLKEKFDLKGKRVAIYCGSGDNGGDGLVCARYLVERDVKVEVFLAGEIRTEAAKKNFDLIKDRVPIADVKESNFDADVMVDALLGTGVKGELREPLRSVVKRINGSKAFKVSVDLPSGLREDGKGYCVKSDLVVTLHRPKLGLEGFNTVVKDIGIPGEAETHVGPGEVIVNLRRATDSHKGENGRVLIVGGGDDYFGAPILSALAALNSGADLVYLAVPEDNYEVTRSYSPDFIVSKFQGSFLTSESAKDIQMRGFDSLLMGPGLGVRDETKKAVAQLLKEVDSPVVLDADALKVIDRKSLGGLKIVVTPHAGEFEILTGKKLPRGDAERKEVLVTQAQKIGSVILLKAPVDLVASPDGRFKFNSTGNAGMTVGGTGDVLAGMTAGFIAQGLDIFEATCCAAFVNGVAGDELYSWKGNCFTASDLAQEIPLSIKKIMDFEEQTT